MDACPYKVRLCYLFTWVVCTRGRLPSYYTTVRGRVGVISLFLAIDSMRARMVK